MKASADVVGLERKESSKIQFSRCRVWFLKQSIHRSHILILHTSWEDCRFQRCLQFHGCIELLVLWILVWSPRCRNPRSRRRCEYVKLIDIESLESWNKRRSCVLDVFGLLSFAGEREEVAGHEALWSLHWMPWHCVSSDALEAVSYWAWHDRPVHRRFRELIQLIQLERSWKMLKPCEETKICKIRKPGFNVESCQINSRTHVEGEELRNTLGLSMNE